MLTLTIKDGQSLRIGDDIKVEFNRKRDLDRPHSRIYVSISAPKEVVILRQELLEKPQPKP